MDVLHSKDVDTLREMGRKIYAAGKTYEHGEDKLRQRIQIHRAGFRPVEAILEMDKPKAKED